MIRREDRGQNECACSQDLKGVGDKREEVLESEAPALGSESK